MVTSGSTFEIQGALQLEKNLQTLPRRVQKRVVKKAVRAGQRPMQAQARANARAIAGRGRASSGMMQKIARAIVIREPREKKPGVYTLHVQILSESQDAARKKSIGVAGFVHPSERTGKTTYIPAAIEFGHGADKDSAALPFMRPAAYGSQAETMQILERELRAGILREAIVGRSA